MKGILRSQLRITGLETLELLAESHEDLHVSKGRSRGKGTTGTRLIEQNINIWSCKFV